MEGPRGALDVFLTALRRGKISGSYLVAKKTAEIMQSVVGDPKRRTLGELFDGIRETGRKLQAAAPLEFAIGNVVRRILRIIREEIGNRGDEDADAAGDGGDGEDAAPKPAVAVGSNGPALYSFLDSAPAASESFREIQIVAAKQHIVQGIRDLVDELESMQVEIADQALEYLHANEVVMTFGYDKVCLDFFLSAAKKRKFEVVVVEQAPDCKGHLMAKELADANVSVTLITDAAAFGIMARVNKVIAGTHAVMANGGLIATSGVHMIALAAQKHSVPFVVCAGLYKLSPLYPYDQDTFNLLGNPNEALPDKHASGISEDVSVLNPKYDYVPPELVSLYITNMGGQSPSYVYRLLAEYYHQEDYEI